MLPELIAEVGTERQHRKSLSNSLSSTTGPVRIASAYVTDHLLFGVKGRNVQLLTSFTRMDIVSGATSLNALRSLLDAGDTCASLSEGRRLHAKVYIFGDEFALVASANLTKSALDSNIEVGVRFSGVALKDVQAWFDVMWKKATPINHAIVSKLDNETKSLRREYAQLRKKANTGRILRIEVAPAVPSPATFRDLMDKAPRYFVCNTNRKHSPDGTDEDLMRRRHYATTWEEFHYPRHMQRVRKGDVIFMFAKGAGIIGIGRAKGTYEVLQPSSPGRVSDGESPEWRVAVDDWMAWAEHDEDACPWKMPNASFLDVSGNNYRQFRGAVRKHFLRNSEQRI